MAGLEFLQAASLLDPRPLHLEMGLERLPSGVLHVAARTDMHGCTGEMFDWWFRWFHTTQHYVWWHPVDHVESGWENWTPGRYVGATNVVNERLSGAESYRLAIHFLDPSEIFDPPVVAACRAAGDASAIVGGIVGPSDLPRDAAGRPSGGRLLHVARDTPFGCVLRSHFWIGEDLAGQVEAAQLAIVASEEMGFGLMRHAYNEFTFLSRFLPSLYVAENRDRLKPPLPWAV